MQRKERNAAPASARSSGPGFGLPACPGQTPFFLWKNWPCSPSATNAVSSNSPPPSCNGTAIACSRPEAPRSCSRSGLPVTEVSQHTGFPEIMEGRVKTLHPKIHGGLLCRRDKADHLRRRAQRHRADRPGGGEPLSRSRQTVAKPHVDFRGGDREHRHRRTLDAAQRGQEPRERHRGVRSRGLRLCAVLAALAAEPGRADRLRRAGWP
jgi:hypothetical protein